MMETGNMNAINCVGVVSSENTEFNEKQNVNVILVPEDIIQALSSSSYDTTHMPVEVDTINQRNLDGEELGNTNLTLPNCSLANNGDVIQFDNNKDDSVAFGKSFMNLEGNLDGYVLLQTPVHSSVSYAVSTPSMNQFSNEKNNFALFSKTLPIGESENKTIEFIEKQSKNNISPNKFACKHPGCVLSFPTRYKLMRHRKVHNQLEAKHKCDDINCDSIRSSESCLQKIANAQRQIIPLHCYQCNLSFINEIQFIKHLCDFHNEGEVLLESSENNKPEYNDVANRSTDISYGKNSTDDNESEKQSINPIDGIPEALGSEEVLYYLCPHKDCGTLFTSVDDAQDHIKETHVCPPPMDIRKSKVNRPVSTTLEIILTNGTEQSVSDVVNNNKDLKDQVDSYQTDQTYSSDIVPCNRMNNIEGPQISTDIDPSQHLPISSFCIVKTSNANVYAQSSQNTNTGVSRNSHLPNATMPSFINSSTNDNTIVCFVGGASSQKQSGDATKYKCTVFNCNKSFKSLQSFLDHGKKHMESNRYQCKHPSCPWSFSTPYKLKRHMKSHDQVKQHKCTYPGCTSMFSTKYNLQVHLDTLHNEDVTTQTRCEKCNLYFDYKLQLVKHSRVVHGETPKMACLAEGCTKMFYSKATLCAHMKTHTKPKATYICNFEGCGKSFDRPTNFREHFISMHSTYRPFKCEYPGCIWEFATKSKLTRHRLTHDGVKRYQCPIENCAKRFNRREHLRSHLKVHRKDNDNGETPIESNEDNLVYYLCPYVDCCSLFTTLIGAKQHIQKVHVTTSKEATEVCPQLKNQESQPVSITLESMVTTHLDNQVDNIDLSNDNIGEVKAFTEKNQPIVTESLLGSILRTQTETIDSPEKQSEHLLISNVRSIRTSKEEEYGLTTVFTAQDVSPSTIDPSQFLLVESQDYNANSSVNLPDEAMKYLNLPQPVYQSTDRFLNFNDCVPTVDPNMVMEVHKPQICVQQGQNATSESSDDDLQCDGSNIHRINSGSARTDYFAYKTGWAKSLKRNTSSFQTSQPNLHKKTKQTIRNREIDFDDACHSMHSDIQDRNLTPTHEQMETHKDDNYRNKNEAMFIKETLRDRVFAGSTINLSDLA